LTIVRGDALGNGYRSGEFELHRQLSKIGKPVDRAEWSVSPSVPDAYYGAQLNAITFPAAILQPPLFDQQSDDAANFGAIGAIIGHELTHGFDDQGRKFDGAGNLRDWWTAESAPKPANDTSFPNLDRNEPSPANPFINPEKLNWVPDATGCVFDVVLDRAGSLRLPSFSDKRFSGRRRGSR
jgi:hypothetical protein